MTWPPESGRTVRYCLLPLLLIVVALTIGLVSGLGGAAAAGAGGAGMILLIVFLLLGGHRAYGWTGVAVFALTMYASAFGLEALSIATGIPFGFFEHNGESVKFLGVPPLVPLVYVIAGWTAWVLARQIIVGSDPLRGMSRLVVPLAAALILAGYDAVIDPIGGTIGKGWSYAHAGGLSGVPLTNFCGWIVTGFVGFTLFSLAEERLRTRRSAAIFGGRTGVLTGREGIADEQTGRKADGEAVRSGPAARLMLLVPAALWLGLALPSLFPFAHDYTGAVRVDASALAIADIHESAAIVALFSMVQPAVIAIGRVVSRPDRGELSRRKRIIRIEKRIPGMIGESGRMVMTAEGRQPSYHRCIGRQSSRTGRRT